MTSATLNEPYAVHELLTADDSRTACDQDHLHSGELKGRDILCDNDGFWRAILNSRFGKVDAGPIEHRAPCLGYVFTTPLGSPLARRKIVVLGDTSDPSAIAPLAIDADLLVHEATDTSIPTSVDAKAKEHKRTPAFVEAHAKDRGHSTPVMAGQFAKYIRCKQLVLNHISPRFPPADAPDTRNTRSMREIERQATIASGLPPHAIQAAYDFLVVPVDLVVVPSRDQMPNPYAVSTSNDHKGRQHEGDQNQSQRHRKRAKH